MLYVKEMCCFGGGFKGEGGGQVICIKGGFAGHMHQSCRPSSYVQMAVSRAIGKKGAWLGYMYKRQFTRAHATKVDSQLFVQKAVY